MNGRPTSFGTSGNPLLQALSLVVFALLVIGAVVMGAVILALVLGLAVIGAIAFYARLWWLRRKVSSSAPERGGEPGRGRLIDAEYTVVEQRDPDRAAERGSRASSGNDTRVTAQDAYESDDTRRAGR
jgi:hypothetical protein